MALDANRLAAAIKTQIETQVGSAATDQTGLQKFCLALATAIVAEIQGNAQVHVTGVQPGGGSANGTVN